VVVSNQPGVAKGILTEETSNRFTSGCRNRSPDAASLDAIYYCPLPS
jgi:histidinol phosphatase-like enzyme